MYHRKHFGKYHRSFSQVLIQDSNLGFVSGILDQCCHDSQDQNLSHLIIQDFWIKEDVTVIGNGRSGRRGNGGSVTVGSGVGIRDTSGTS